MTTLGDEYSFVVRKLWVSGYRHELLRLLPQKLLMRLVSAAQAEVSRRRGQAESS